MTKEELVKELSIFQEEKEIPIDFGLREYEDWSKKAQKKSYKKTYRW